MPSRRRCWQPARFLSPREPHGDSISRCLPRQSEYVWSASELDNKKRTLIQAAAALLQNGHLTGFFTGRIYEGAGKNVCVPGLNCYSCPGALGACPIGSLQNALSAWKFRFPCYVLGFMVFFGAAFGRLICGFLCPFGFLQDLLFRIPSPKKLRTFPGDRQLRYVKYAVLLLMVAVLPFAFKFTPFYCKCLSVRHAFGNSPLGSRQPPAGTLGLDLHLEGAGADGGRACVGRHLPSLLQISLPAGRLLRPLQQGFGGQAACGR